MPDRAPDIPTAARNQASTLSRTTSAGIPSMLAADLIR
jgi:hypothetical protein